MKLFVTGIIFLIVVCLEASVGYVVNSGSATLSRIDFESGEIDNNFSALGTSANRVALTQEYAYVVNSGDNSVQKIDLETGATMAEIYIGSSTNPYDMVIGDGFGYVSCGLSNQISKIDLSSDEVIETITVGNNPAGMTIYNNQLYAGNTDYTGDYENCSVSIINLSTFEVSETIPTEVNPQFLAEVNGNIHISCGGNWADITGNICILEPASNEISEIIELGGITSNFAQMGNKVYVADGWGTSLYAYFADSFDVIYNSGNPFTPGGTMAAADQTNLFVLSGEWGQNCLLTRYDQNENFIDEFEVGVYATDIKIWEEETYSSNDEFPIMNYKLSNFPNPFNPSTTISFKISNEQNEQYELVIYNLKGQEVKTLECVNRVDAKATESLCHSVVWNGKDNYGNSVSSGIYLYKLVLDGQQIAANKLLLLK